MRYTQSNVRPDVCQVIRFSVHAAGKIMKGPSLRYDLRVLRVFRCDACGRQVQTPGSVTTQTCLCSDPPKFMRPVDRPRTVSPDVSRFISPADPQDLIEVNEIDETPYVVHVPVKPPPPARFANRRKLYEDTAAPDEPDFGEGIVNHVADDSPVRDDAPTEISWNPGIEKPGRESDPAAGDKGRSRGRGRGRGSEPDTARPPGSNAAPPARRPDARGRPDVRGRPGAGQPGATRDAGRTNPGTNGKLSGSDRSGPSDGDAQPGSDSTAAPTSSEPASSEQGEGRRRSRRRGRRRGPRPEGGDA